MFFSKIGDDYICVSINVIKNGERVIGIKLVFDGKVIKKINQQEVYYGVVDILGSFYLIGYELMFNSSGDVVGIWYVGYLVDFNVLE